MSVARTWVPMVGSGIVGAALAIAVTGNEPIREPVAKPVSDRQERHIEVREIPAPQGQGVSPRTELRLTDLERQLEALRAEKTKEVNTTSPDTLPSEEIPAHIHAVMMDEQFEADEPGNSWSRRAESRISEALTTLTTSLGATLVDAECRAERCRSTVQWNDYAEARKSFSQLAERAIPGLNCAQTILVPEPDDPSAPYSAKLHFDCAGRQEIDSEGNIL